MGFRLGQLRRAGAVVGDWAEATVERRRRGRRGRILGMGGSLWDEDTFWGVGREGQRKW